MQSIEISANVVCEIRDFIKETSLSFVPRLRVVNSINSGSPSLSSKRIKIRVRPHFLSFRNFLDSGSTWTFLTGIQNEKSTNRTKGRTSDTSRLTMTWKNLLGFRLAGKWDCGEIGSFKRGKRNLRFLVFRKHCADFNSFFFSC